MAESTEAIQQKPILNKEAPQPEIERQNWWKIGFFIVTILLLVVSISFAYFLVSIRRKELKETPSPSPVVVTPTPSLQLTPEIILEEIRNGFSQKFPTLEIGDCEGTGEFDWLRNDGYAIRIKGQCLANYGSENFTEMSSELETVWSANDFTKNESNSYSYDSHDTGPLIYTLALENDQIKCLAEWRKGFKDPSRQHNSFYTIYCGLYDQLNDPLNEILPVLETDMRYVLRKKVGNYAVGDVGSFPCCGGAFWIAVKEGGQWKIIFKGQESLSCEVVDQYEVPKEIYGDCWEESLEKLRFGNP